MFRCFDKNQVCRDKYSLRFAQKANQLDCVLVGGAASCEQHDNKVGV